MITEGSIEAKLVIETTSALEIQRRKRPTCSEIIWDNYIVEKGFEFGGPCGTIRIWIIIDKDIPRKRYLSLLSSVTLILPELP